MTYNAGNNGSIGPRISERFFVSDAVLDNHDSRLVLVNGGCNRLYGGILIDSLVRADNVVERLPGFGRGLEDFLRNDGVFAVVLGVHNQALFRDWSINLATY